jgi:hypothetical protein
VAIAIIGSLAVLDGGAFAGYKFLGNGHTETTQAVITPTPEPAKAAAEPAKPVEPPPPPPAVETKPADTKPADTSASATPQQPKPELRVAAPVTKGRPVAPPPRPAPPPTKTPAKGPGAPDFGY